MKIYIVVNFLVRTKTRAATTFWLITILHLTVTWYVVNHRSNRKSTSFNLFIQTSPYMISKNMTVTEQPTTSYDKLLQQIRLGMVKRELNVVSLTNETIYPANRIGNYIFSNPNLCEDVPSIDFIIIVQTATTHFERRQRIRATFANTSLFYPAQIRTAFLLGKANDSAITEKLWQEHRTYNDTVMGDFIDDYYNLTLKGVMGLRWVKDHCPNAAFVLRIDDDVVINMFTLVYLFLPQMKTKKRTIVCEVHANNTLSVARNGRWKVDSHIFPNRTTYPYPYCAGYTVLLTPDLIDELYQAAKVTPFFWIDDNYLFGLLPFVIGNINFTNYELYRFLSPLYKNAINCTLPQTWRCPLYTILIKDNEFWPLWYNIKSMYSTINWSREATNQGGRQSKI
ncbi:unnamed protein product [Candidula unifasciata]|uniref:Hexosyltransferase n=1 Tax=Candidula unifasciata TaxID=100452 RepID=A0A8S3YYM4_9EUPU|nr:unnamed protein product [Candidula unifasciata]